MTLNTQEGPLAGDISHVGQTTPSSLEKVDTKDQQVEEVEVEKSAGDPVFDLDEEPELSARTYIALFSILLLNLVQIVALQGPPTFLDYIGQSLNNTAAQSWVPNALNLVQAVLGPIISAASDTFQARKPILLVTCVFSFVGSAIAPGAQSLGRLIAAQILIGAGFSAVGIGYSIPSEVLPRRWRPMAQAGIGIAACIGGVLGPVIIGAFTEKNKLEGWRNFYWVQMGLWAVTAVGIFVGYRPPKRHSRFDHLSFWQKLGKLDMIGGGLLLAGLTLLMAGLSLGGGLYSWTNAATLVPIVLGGILLICFGVYETYGTETGILHHDLFRKTTSARRTVWVCTLLIFLEGIMNFSCAIFYPSITVTLFEQRPMFLVARFEVFWIAIGVSSPVWGYVGSHYRTIREPLAVGFALFTGGLIGLATLQPDDDLNSIVFAALAGTGLAAGMILIVAGVQLSTPHHLIATATSVITSSRAIAASIFTAIFSAAFRTRYTAKVPSYVGEAVVKAGLPQDSILAFIQALTGGDTAALATVAGVDAVIIAQGVAAFKQAFADSVRVVFIIAIPFGAVAVVAACFAGRLKQTMTYRVDAPVEVLHAKHEHSEKHDPQSA